MLAEKKRASGPIRLAIRSVPAADSSEAALFVSAASRRASLSVAAHRNASPAVVDPSSASLHSVMPPVEPAAFLSLIKTDPTRAFQLIFPGYDVDDSEQHTDTTVHTSTPSRARVEQEEKETADGVGQPVSPSPLSPYSPGWKYQHTAAFDVHRPDTAGREEAADG